MLKKKKITFFLFLRKNKEGEEEGVVREQEREKAKLGSYWIVEPVPRGQSHSRAVFLSGGGQHVLPLFSLFKISTDVMF